MNHEDLRNLLNRYYRAETTFEEEERLRSRLSDPGLPDAFKKDALLFKTLDREREVRMPDDQAFELRFKERTGTAENKQSAGVWLAAAVVVLVFSGWIFLRMWSVPVMEQRKHYSEAEINEAYEDTRRAFGLIAGVLHTGREQMAALDQVTYGSGHLMELRRLPEAIKPLEAVGKLKNTELETDQTDNDP